MDIGLPAVEEHERCSSAAGKREIMIINTSIHLRKRRFLTRMEEIPLFHQRGCIKTVTWRFSYISWRWVKALSSVADYMINPRRIYDK